MSNPVILPTILSIPLYYMIEYLLFYRPWCENDVITFVV